MFWHPYTLTGPTALPGQLKWARRSRQYKAVVAWRCSDQSAHRKALDSKWGVPDVLSLMFNHLNVTFDIGVASQSRLRASDFRSRRDRQTNGRTAWSVACSPRVFHSIVYYLHMPISVIMHEIKFIQLGKTRPIFHRHYQIWKNTGTFRRIEHAPKYSWVDVSQADNNFTGCRYLSS